MTSKPASITVTVKLYGALRRRRPAEAEGASHQPFIFTLSDQATIGDLTEALQIADGMVNAAAVNGEAVSPDASLREGDQVSLFPPAAGG
jgi:molybdopterin converting factor small subunit